MSRYIVPEVLYLPSSYAVIAESASTTNRDMMDGFVQFLDSYKEEGPYKENYRRELQPRRYNYKESREKMALNYLKPLNDVLNLIEGYESFTFFKLLYVRYLYYPIKQTEIFRVISLYKSARSSPSKRTYLKAYYFMNSYFDRFGQSLVTIKKEINLLIRILGNRSFINLTDDYKVYLLKVLEKNRLVINAIDLARNYACQFGNLIVGSTTSTVPLIVYYQLLGELNALRDKHIRIANNFNAYMSKYRIRSYMDNEMLRDQFAHSLENAKAVLGNNILGLKYLLNTVVNYNNTILDYVVKLVTNSKSSTVTPFSFNFHEFVPDYHIKTLMCFNTVKYFNFSPADHVGSAEHYSPVYFKYLEEIFDKLPININSDFFLEITSFAIIVSTLSLHGKFNKFFKNLKYLSTLNERKEGLISKVKILTSRFQTFTKHDIEEAKLQSFMVITNNKGDIFFKNLKSFEENVLKLTDFELKIYFEFNCKVGYKFLYKNFLDLLYLPLFRFGKFIYFLELLQKNQALFTGEHSAKIFKEHFNQFKIVIIKDVDALLGTVFNEMISSTCSNRIIEEFRVIALSISRDSKIEDLISAMKNMSVALVKMENIVTKSGMRLTFRRDQKFEWVNLGNIKRCSSIVN